MSRQDNANGATRHVTIRTVADEAGVHASTVSRVLRRGGEPRSATDRRILEVAARLGYQPNVFASTLRTRRPKMIGVLVPRMTDVVMATLYEAIDEVAVEFGFQPLVASTNDLYDEQIRRAGLLLSHGAVGLLIADAHIDGRYIAWLKERGVPHLQLMRQVGLEPAVVADDEAGGRLVGAHLADTGHSNIVILTGMPWSSATTRRVEGCRKALLDRGIELREECLEPSTALDSTSGQQAIERLLARAEKVTAVFAVDDSLAMGAIIALREHKLEAGIDVAVVGYNDTPIAAALGLTTVHNPLKEMGAIATRLLFNVIEGHHVETVCLSPHLIPRSSSAPRSVLASTTR